MTLEISNANISISLIQTTMEIYLDQNQGLKLRKKQCLLFVVVVVVFSDHTVCIFARFNLLRSRGKMAH